MKRSENISAIAKALSGFNSEVSKISKDSANPFFKNNYASLDNIIDEVRPILTKHGLTIMQFPSSDGLTVSVTTYLLHDSGEWIESEPLNMKPVKVDPQGIGSCITYARRYSLQAFLSLNTGEDDDGNNASNAKAPTGNKQTSTQQQTKQQTQQQPNQQSNENKASNLISEPQKKKINVLVTQVIEKHQTTRVLVMKSLHKKPGIGVFDSIVELTKAQASKVIEELEKVVGGEKK
jgi:hypothetical protein